MNTIIDSFHPSIITPIDIREAVKGRHISNIERISTKNIDGMRFSEFKHLLDESKQIHTMLNRIGSLPLRNLLNHIEGEIVHYERWYDGELKKIKIVIPSFDEDREPLSFLFNHHQDLFTHLQQLYVRCADANVLYEFFNRQDDHIILLIGEWHATNIEKLLEEYKVYNATKVGEYEYNISNSYF